MRWLQGGLELDDDRARVDVAAVHAFLTTEAYWARGRSRNEVERLVQQSSRVVGLYDGDAQVGFSRAVTDGTSFAYLADVYVLPSYRGRGLGRSLIEESIDGSPWRDQRWLLHTKDAHELYARFGFGAPNERLLERPRRWRAER
jgi:GNAT superfamily N-acetyltransferase